ncbi:MAG: hypothetical protein ABR517_07215 [Thermoanaerobaculia bacterium]
MRFGNLLLALVLLLAGGCASSGVDLEEPRRLLGTEDGVRVDAQIFTESFGPGTSLRMTWDITNERAEPIAVADLVPAVSFEEGERTVVIHLGSEVPGHDLLPRLVEILPGEKKNFSGVARLNLNLPPPTPISPYPRYVQIRVSVLSEVEPFRVLVGIRENAIADSALADEMFTRWLESVVSIRTNPLPIDWMGARRREAEAARQRF